MPRTVIEKIWDRHVVAFLYNGGNMSSAMGPFAVKEGPVKAAGKEALKAYKSYQSCVMPARVMTVRQRAISSFTIFANSAGPR